MDKTLQDLAWSMLPKEFKEEVKTLYCEFRFTREGYYNELFGPHNLTSDAEGEMLYADKSKVQKIFAGQTEVQKSTPCGTILHHEAAAKAELLYTLFGSKCLPDNVESSEPNVDSLPQNPTENCDYKSHISADCNKPAEPKFKIGDKVKDISSPHDGGIYKVDDIKKSSNGFIYHIQGLIGKSNVKESDLEPYTEPANEGTRQEQCVPQNAESGTRSFDAILKDSFRDERRLNIAAMAMQGYLSSNGSGDPKEIACYALAVADALIKSSEKGGSDGN